MQTTYLKINPADSVVVCLSPKKKGDLITVDGRRIKIVDELKLRQISKFG